VNDPSPLAALPELPVEVYRSHWRPACEERAFVLHAVGISSQVVAAGPNWSLLVAPASAAAALGHIRVYDRENPPRRRTLPAHEPLHRLAWTGAVVYCLVLLAVAWLAGHKAFATDWLDAGVLRGALLQSGEPWRAITALTLHFDVAHLLGNLGFGAFFGWLAAQLLGPGVAFGTAIIAAAITNFLNGSIQGEDYVSGGASTVVFALLGLLSAYAWKRRASDGERWAYRWAPLIAGVCLLGFTGVGGERTDVAAHLGGFIMGAVGGWLLALRVRRPGGAVQWLAGLGALAAIAEAWWFALGSSAS